MPSTLKPPQRAIQLMLFRSTRSGPSWEAVPLEVQQQVLRLLTRLMRDHVAHRNDAHAGEEDRDE